MEQAGLANARLADDGHGMAAAVDRVAQHVDERDQRRLAADEGGEAAVLQARHGAAVGRHAHDAVRLDRRASAPQRHGTERDGSQPSRQQARRRPADQDLAGLGERLQPGRDVRRVAHGVVPARVVPERRDHQGPAVDADPDPRALGHLAPGTSRSRSIRSRTARPASTARSAWSSIARGRPEPP